MPVASLGIPPVARKGHLGNTSSEVKDLEGGVVGGCDELEVGRCDGQVANGIMMAPNAFDIVEVGLPVLDDTIVVGRDQPIVGVRVLESADGGIVRLHNGLKVEGCSVPEGKLSTAGCCQEAAAFWGPSNDVDRVFDLVKRLVDPTSWYRICCIGGSCSRGNHLRTVVSPNTWGLDFDETYVNEVAGAWSFKLASIGAFVF